MPLVEGPLILRPSKDNSGRKVVRNMLSDSHTHLDQYQPWEIDGLLNRALEAGVGPIITAGTTIESSRNCIALASRYPNVFAGVGIHPMDIRSPFTQDTYDLLKELAESSEKVIAVSEVGLDFMEGAPDRELQYHAFRKQIGLAKELGLPIVFHSREAHDETLSRVAGREGLRGWGRNALLPGRRGRRR